MKETKKPAIRFQGFSDEWERRSMGELTTELHEYATLDSLYPLLTSSREGIMFQDEYRSNRTTENNKTLFSVVPYGKCTYRHMSDDDIFHFNINDIVEKGLVSREYPVFDSTDDNDLRFIVVLLNSSEQFRRFCRVRKMGGTRTRLYYKHLSNFEPLCPIFDEQTSIADFLDIINGILSCRQSKLEKLQILKASMLEKMFPKDGADVPEIRFNGFTGAFERKHASELFASYVDKGHPELPVLSATQDAGMVVRDEIGKSVFHDRANESGYKRVMPGQFVIHLRSFQGGFAHSAIEGITSPAYTVFNFREPEKHDDYYWKYVFASKQFIKRLETVTYGIRDGRSISYEEFLTLDFLFPKKEEQSKICTYLRDLDLLISLRRQELNKLQTFKKSLLEKMFV